MTRVRRRGTRPKRVRVGVPDPSLTGLSGVAAVAEFAGKLDLVGTLDRGIGRIKKRDRGATAGQVLLAVAQSQLLGADALVGLDRQRPDPAMTWLSVVPVLPATTAAGLARRFDDTHLAGIERGVPVLVGRFVGMLPATRRVGLTSRVTIDLDSTDVEVYGSRKRGVGLQLRRATLRPAAPGSHRGARRRGISRKAPEAGSRRARTRALP